MNLVNSMGRDYFLGPALCRVMWGTRSSLFWKSKLTPLWYCWEEEYIQERHGWCQVLVVHTSSFYYEIIKVSASYVCVALWLHLRSGHDSSTGKASCHCEGSVLLIYKLAVCSINVDFCLFSEEQSMKWLSWTHGERLWVSLKMRL